MGKTKKQNTKVTAFSYQIVDEASETVTVQFNDHSRESRYPRTTVVLIDKKTWRMMRNNPDHLGWQTASTALEQAHPHKVIKTITPPKHAGGDWLETIGFLVPKSVREPWLGDLREDRESIRQAGHGRFFVTLVTIGQFASLVVASLWSDLKETVARSLRMT